MSEGYTSGITSSASSTYTTSARATAVAMSVTSIPSPAAARRYSSPRLPTTTARPLSRRFRAIERPRFP
jgi:hypothetical protein